MNDREKLTGEFWAFCEEQLRLNPAYRAGFAAGMEQAAVIVEGYDACDHSAIAAAIRAACKPE
jgi:hypothetical protein